jgi:hypothetical protein
MWLNAERRYAPTPTRRYISAPARCCTAGPDTFPEGSKRQSGDASHTTPTRPTPTRRPVSSETPNAQSPVKPQYSSNLTTPRIRNAGFDSANVILTRKPSNFPSGRKHKSNPAPKARIIAFVGSRRICSASVFLIGHSLLAMQKGYARTMPTRHPLVWLKSSPGQGTCSG